MNLETPEWSQVPFGAKSLKVYGSKVWKSFSFHIKTSEHLIQFKSLLTLYFPMFPFDPPENIRKPLVF